MEDNNRITLKEITKKSIMKKAEEFKEKEIKEIEYKNKSDLLKATNIFVENMEMYCKLIEADDAAGNFMNYLKNKNTSKENRKGRNNYEDWDWQSNNAKNKYRMIKEARQKLRSDHNEHFKEMYLQTEKYRDILSNYLGKERNLVFYNENENGEVVLYQVKNITKDMLSLDTSSNNRLIFKGIENFIKGEQEKNKIEIENKEIFNYFNNILNLLEERKKMYRNRILYKNIEDHWEKEFLIQQNHGNLIEASLRLYYLNKDSSIEFLKNWTISKGIEYFIFQGLKNNDNIAAIFREDIEFGNKSIGAKKLDNFSFAGYRKIISEAKKVLEFLKQGKSETEINKYFQKKIESNKEDILIKIEDYVNKLNNRNISELTK